MPRFYFDVFDNGRLITDDVGTELPDLYEARKQALSLLPAVASDISPDGDQHDFTAVVRCHERRIRFRTTLSVRSEWIEPPDHAQRE